MQKSDIESLKEELISITKEISELMAIEITENGQIEKISDLYTKRKSVIVNIKKYLDSDEGQAYLENNADKWKEFVNLFDEIESKNLKYLKQSADSKSKQVRQLHKQKSVLIYTKGK